MVSGRRALDRFEQGRDVLADVVIGRAATVSRCHTVIYRDGSGCDLLRLHRVLHRSGLAHRARMPSGVDEHHRCYIASTKVPSLQRGGGWVALSTISGSRNHGPPCPTRDPSSRRAGRPS